MSIKMRVKEYAYARGIRTIGELSRHADIPLSTARRLWFSTADGLEHGPPLQRIDFEVLEKCARFFGVAPGALLEMVSE